MQMTGEQQAYIIKRFHNSGYAKEVTNAVLDYIGENKDYLSMFAHYLITKMIMIDNGNSHLMARAPKPFN